MTHELRAIQRVSVQISRDKERIERLTQRIADNKRELAQILDLEPAAGNHTPRLGRPPGRPRRHMSAAARRRIGRAMKQRWAERKQASSNRSNGAAAATRRRWVAYRAGKTPRPGTLNEYLIKGKKVFKNKKGGKLAAA